MHMELLNYPSTDYLLDATLESLHTQSIAWLKELDFWGDEMSFFYHLLQGQKKSQPFPAAEIAQMEKELVRLNGDELDKLRSRVGSHERNLSQVYRSTSTGEEQRYRDSHKKLLTEMYHLHEDIRKFKRNVFSFVMR